MPVKNSWICKLRLLTLSYSFLACCLYIAFFESLLFVFIGITIWSCILKMNLVRRIQRNLLSLNLTTRLFFLNLLRLFSHACRIIRLLLFQSFRMAWIYQARVHSFERSFDCNYYMTITFPLSKAFLYNPFCWLSQYRSNLWMTRREVTPKIIHWATGSWTSQRRTSS